VNLFPTLHYPFKFLHIYLYAYHFKDEGFPVDFFCYGLPGNTLPLGNWDPWGLHQVSKKVVRKYRESEIKHGRLAMLSTVGFMMQEKFHPMHPEIGGLAITHMNQLSFTNSFFRDMLPTEARSLVDFNGLDFGLVVLFMCSFELFALRRNWNRWLPNEYNNQFDHNIGLGNLKKVCYILPDTFLVL
jgi:hypothetical protein